MLANYKADELVTGFAYDKVWEGNWKLATENGMEFYHHMGLHAVTLEADLPARQAEMDPAPASGRFAHSRCFYSEAVRNQAEGLGNAPRPNCKFAEHELNSAYAIGLFPNISLAMSMTTNNWLSFIPLGPERTRVIGGFTVAQEMAADAEVMKASNELVCRVNEEDGQATWRLQQVMRSAKAAPGSLNVREGTCAQFSQIPWTHAGGRSCAGPPGRGVNCGDPNPRYQAGSMGVSTPVAPSIACAASSAMSSR